MRDNTLITVTLKDKRRVYGHVVKYFHENSITPEIYRFIKKKRAIIVNIQCHFDKLYCYYHRSTPSIDDFLKEYKGAFAERRQRNIKLTPSPNGEKCKGNGTGKAECCCDECDYYLICFPQNGKGIRNNRQSNKT